MWNDAAPESNRRPPPNADSVLETYPADGALPPELAASNWRPRTSHRSGSRRGGAESVVLLVRALKRRSPRKWWVSVVAQ